MTTSNGSATAPGNRFTSSGVISEFILLALVGAFFLYVYLSSVERDIGVAGWLLPWRFEWGSDGWLFLRVLSLFSLPLWAWRVVLLFRPIPGSRLNSIEFTGEVILLAAVGAFFVYMYWDSVELDAGSLAWLPWRLDWGDGGWLLPRIAILFGAPFWVWRAVSLFRTASEQGAIMDTGFLETDDDPRLVMWRWVQLLATTGALLVGCWVLGFHIAVPLYTVLYLTILGKVKWYWTLLPAVFFEVIIVAIYGYILLSEWGTPVAREWPIIGSIWDVTIDAWHNFYEANLES